MPELDNGRRCRLLPPACSRAPVPLPRRLRSAQLLRQPGFSGGVALSVLLRKGRLQLRSSSCRCTLSRALPDQFRLCTNSSHTPVGPVGLSRAALRAARSGRVGCSGADCG